MTSLFYNVAIFLALACAALAANEDISCGAGDPAGQCVPTKECRGKNKIKNRSGCNNNERCCLLCHSGKRSGQCVDATIPAKCTGKERLGGRAGCAANQICCEAYFNEDCHCSYSPASGDQVDNGIIIEKWCRPWPDCRLKFTKFV